jgi:hypothetical protein
MLRRQFKPKTCPVRSRASAVGAHQDGFGNHKTQPTGSTEPYDDDDAMKKKLENVAHAHDGISRRSSRIQALAEFATHTRDQRLGATVLAIAGMAALAAPMVIGMIVAPGIRAQSAATPTPKFDVASIRPCVAGDPGVGDRSGGGSPPPSWSPGRVTVTCQPVIVLIREAYIHYAGDQSHSAFETFTTPVEGGPGWMDSDGYTVNAEAEGGPSRAMMMGPILRALLEDRFKLQIHRETKEVQVYALTVAKSGPKLQKQDEVPCTPRDPNDPRAQLKPGNSHAR